MPTHPIERAGFDAEPIARVILQRRILLEGKNAISGINPIDPAIAAPSQPGHAQHGSADEFPRDNYRRIGAAVIVGQRKPSPR
jgi:hypothetical protein